MVKRFCEASILFLCIALSACSSTVPELSITEPVSSTLPAPTPPSAYTVNFSASGDNLIHGSIYLQARTKDGSYDFHPLYEQVTAFYKNYDLNFINQETLVNDEIKPSSYPCFSTPGELGKAAYDTGFRLFGGSNNHTYDNGSAGIAATLRFWDTMPEDCLYFGLYNSSAASGEEDLPLYHSNGISFACLAFTEFTNGFPTPSDAPARVIYTSEEETMERLISKAATQADLVVVSVHWGIEDSHFVTEEQRLLAQKMANWGADVIIGTHPHVIQSIEWIDRTSRETPTLCAYSLGNFVSAQSRPDELFGIVLTFTVTKSGDAGTVSLSNVQAHPTITHYGSNYSNIRVLFLKDYSDEQLAQHGACKDYPYFDRAYITSVLSNNIAPSFLAA